MYQLDLINRLLSQYKIWTVKLKNARVSIENNILQTDNTNLLEQKIMSITISSLFVWIVTAIVGLFGVATGGLGIVLFIVGWLLSKLVNKVLFGNPRKFEDISENEKELFFALKKVENRHISIRDSINNHSIVVNFSDYTSLKKEFENILFDLNNFNTRYLAIKYKLKHKYVVSKYKIEVNKFHKIYAHK